MFPILFLSEYEVGRNYLICRYKSKVISITVNKIERNNCKCNNKSKSSLALLVYVDKPETLPKCNNSSTISHDQITDVVLAHTLICDIYTKITRIISIIQLPFFPTHMCDISPKLWHSYRKRSLRVNSVTSLYK